MEINCFDVASGILLYTLRGPAYRGEIPGTTDLAISCDGQWLVTIAESCAETGIVVNDVRQCDQVARLDVWDLGSNHLLASDDSPRAWHHVAFAPDSQTFAVVDTAGVLDLWNVQRFVNEFAVSGAAPDGAIGKQGSDKE